MMQMFYKSVFILYTVFVVVVLANLNSDDLLVNKFKLLCNCTVKIDRDNQNNAVVYLNSDSYKAEFILSDDLEFIKQVNITGSDMESLLPSECLASDRSSAKTRIFIDKIELTNDKSFGIYCKFVKSRSGRSLASDLPRPQFSKRLYTMKLSQSDIMPKTQISKISVINMPKDLSNLDVRFKATRDTKSSQMFTSELADSELIIKSTDLFNNSSNSVHYFRIFIIDKHNPETVFTKCSLVINILDSSMNKAPQFKFNPYQVQIFENNAPDTLVIRVEATDDDYAENGRVVYSLINPNQLPFQIKSDTGEIFAKKSLNREQKDLFELTVKATDNAPKRLSSTTQVIIRVLAQRDLVPKFVSTSSDNEYNLTLSEDTDFTKNPIVFKVNATDSYPNTNLIYSLWGSLNDMNTFEIDSRTGTIRLVSKLNYQLKSTYRLNIIARDLGYPSSATHSTLNINIEDMNRLPPVFTAPFYEFILFENAQIGYLVGKVIAYDKEAPNRNVTFSIEENLNSNSDDKFPFSIDPNNGTIYTIKRLYKNYKHGYEFYVRASTTASSSYQNGTTLNSSVKVKVKILDINDVVPEFSKKLYQLNISEEAAIGLPLLTLTVINNKDSYLEYSFESGNDMDMFSLMKQTNTRVFLTLERTSLNYKKKSFYELSVKVMDQDGLYSICIIQINVLPNNNYSPRFTKDLYVFQVNENSPIGTCFGSVNAIVIDRQIQIIYKLITNTENLASSASEKSSNPGFNSDLHLDELTGSLCVSNKLDREKNDVITLYVTAADKEKPFQTDHAIVQVQILDANDNSPVFTRDFYQIDVYQDFPLNSYLIRIEAVDRDLGANGNVRYALDNSINKNQFVSIDPETGVVRLLKHAEITDDMTVQEQLENITIISYDLGQPSLSSRSILLLKFIFKNDNPPQFVYTKFDFYLHENEPVGTVVGQIEAFDLDLGSSSDISFKILDRNDLFELRAAGKYNTVALVTKFIADYQIRRNKPFNLIIRAYSGYLYTDCSVNIHIKDQNDNSPVLPESFKIVFNNYKNYFLTEQNPRVPLIDFDVTSNLSFNLADSVGRQLVNLDEKTGILSLKSVLNSNNQINVSFLISLNDGEHQASTRCDLVVFMLTDSLISESITLNLLNVQMSHFLNTMYDRFIETIQKSIQKSIKQPSVHLINLKEVTNGLNLTLAVSYDYERDNFIPGSLLKQIIYSNIDQLERNLRLSKAQIYEDESCAIEPCLNYQQCQINIRFSQASNEYLVTNSVQFRPISVRHDFSCSCPVGYTGTNTSLTCDLEINLCYSNPCGQNGLCLSVESSFVCICDPDYTGRTCEHNLKTGKCCSDSGNNQPSTGLFIGQKSTISAPLVNTSACIDDESLAVSDQVCKGKSMCRNINDEVKCDKCDDSPYYNKFCELRTKHFPKNERAFMTFPGLSNRFRFKIKLSFATVKSDGFLFHNGRIDNNQMDFIDLRIIDDKLVFEYSLGGAERVQIGIGNLVVTDGKWRTVTIEYSNRNFSLSLDNDNLEDIDACELARNKKSDTRNECIRVNHYHNLADKCLNQIENCFRFFDLNGPLKLGAGPYNNSDLNYFTGCLGDLIINDKLIDMQDAIFDYKTQVGCAPKLDSCLTNDQLKDQCSKCNHIWENSVKCSCKKNENYLDDNKTCTNNPNALKQVYNLQGNGYLLYENITYNSKEMIEIKLSVKISNLQVPNDKPMLIMQINMNNNQLRLNYDSSNKKFNLYYDNQLLLSLNRCSLPSDSDYQDWVKLKIQLSPEGSITTIVDDVFMKSANKKMVLDQENFLSIYIGNINEQIYQLTGLIGCVRDVSLNNKYLTTSQLFNATAGCLYTPRASTIVISEPCGRSLNDSPCFNNATCSLSNSADSQFTCSCSEGYKGKYCQFENKSRMSLVSNKNNCPAKWWGKDSGICGPCKCDEEKNFSPDCNKTTGQCNCKPKFYKQINKVTKEERCVPCDCYLEGSTSLQCDQETGQCSCLRGAGITGRRCDQCVSPLAELSLKGNECRQLSSNECPRAFAYNIWWQRSPFNNVANASCPKGSIGIAYRSCVEGVGWLNDVDLSDCKSIKIIDSQLYKWSNELISNKSQLNSYQTFKLVEELDRITLEADENDDLITQIGDISSYSNMYTFDYFLSTSTSSLYAFDILVIRDLIRDIIHFEIDNSPSFLYIQDKHFLNNLFSILNRIMNKKYELKLMQFMQRNTNASSVWNDLRNVPLIDSEFLDALNQYLNVIVKYNQDYPINDQIELGLSNFQLFLRSVHGDSYSEISPVSTVKFKIFTKQSEQKSNESKRKISFISLNSVFNNFPRNLLIQSTFINGLQRIKSLNYRVASNVFILNSAQTESEKFNIVIDFALTNNYETNYDPSNDIISYRNLKTVKSDYNCVHLNKELNLWSSIGARLISFDPQSNTVKCSFDHDYSVYAVVIPTVESMKNLQSPINFSIASFILMPVSLLVLFLTIIILSFLRKFRTALTIVHTNLCLNVFLMQLIFFVGVNSNSSQIICKFISILQHYFNLSSYLWMLIISLHLYRMLTELRDINKVGSCSPVFYYVIAYVTPTIIVSLTLGIKQEIYTNYDSLGLNGNLAPTQFDLSSVYCWLNITNFNDVLFVYVLPVGLIVLFFLILCFMSYKESRKSTFKQTDISLVHQSLIASLIILPFKCLITIFLIMFLNTSTVMTQTSFFNESSIYQHIYLVFSLIYSLLVFFIFILFNKHNRLQLTKAWDLFKNKNLILNESLNTSKTQNKYQAGGKIQTFVGGAEVCKQKTETAPGTGNNLNLVYHPNNIRVNTIPDQVPVHLMQQPIVQNQGKYMLDYHDFHAHTNSISTTTTSGTLENMDDVNSQDSDYMKQNYLIMGMQNGNGYMSNLVNTTNTESTTNESDFNYNFDFNRPAMMLQNQKMEIRECDVVDVGKILKSRNLLMGNSPASAPVEQALQSNIPCQNDQPVYYNSADNYAKHLTAEQAKKTSPLSLFWPNKIAECDTSFLEGSVIYTPSKIPFAKCANVETVPDLLTCSNNIGQMTNNKAANNSYLSTSSTSQAKNVYSTSSSSLILNCNSNLPGNLSICAVDKHQNNMLNYSNGPNSCENVPIFNHSGSPASSENESNNETRV